MDTLSVLVLTVIIMSIAIVTLLLIIRTAHLKTQRLLSQLEEISKKYQREKYRNLLVGNSGIKLGSTMENERTLHRLLKTEK